MLELTLAFSPIHLIVISASLETIANNTLGFPLATFSSITFSGEHKKTGLYHETSSSSIKLQASTFLTDGHPILTQVPPNTTATQTNDVTSIDCFICFDANQPTTTAMWFSWETQWDYVYKHFQIQVTEHPASQTKGSNVKNQTQMMMLENYDHPYVLLLPLNEGPFRASLQPSLR